MIRPALLLSLFCITLTAAAAEPFTNAPPLLPNGGFEEVDPTNAAKPKGWDVLDGLGVRWVKEEGAETNRVIRMDTAVSEKAYVDSCRAAGLDKWVFPNAVEGPIAGTYGLSYYSDSLPVSTGQAYRLTFRARGAGGAKVWVRGYGVLRNEERRRYDTVVNCHGLKRKDWTLFSQCFHPTRNTPTVTRMRLMLYAYWPPGIYEFDDVRLEPVTDEEWLADHTENE